MAQINLLVGDIAGNAEKIIQAAFTARDQFQSDLIIFPELTLTGYPPEDLLMREGLLKQAQQALEKIKQEVDGITLVIGLPARIDEKLYNTAVVIRDKQNIAVYHKYELPNYGVFDEVRYFQPGVHASVFEINGIKIGLTICEDIWFKTASEKARNAGAEIIVNLNASPFHLGKLAEREQQVIQRSQENRLPVAYVNLVGGQDELVFDGASFITNADGDIIFRGVSFAEELTHHVVKKEDGLIEIEPGTVSPHPPQEESVFKALVTGVHDYVKKSGFNGAVIGLSGGIDSAVTLVVAVEALGAENIEVLMMPSRFTADMSLQDAEKLAHHLDVDYRVLPIEKAFATFMDILADEFAGLPEDTTEENIQARCRGLMLMAVSNKKGKIVLTTGNKSEMAVGYSTLYGDMAGGFDVLKDVPKTLVYKLSRWINREQEIIPWRIIERPPSAELRADQTDQDSLPPYEILDDILERYISHDQSVSAIVADGFDAAVVRKITRMVDQNEYKRRQAPPGVRITPRAFGKDRRYPIISGFSDV
jgi:NAD+ synthase (glutamine-hydrolysing)